jgi:hypothetical protein
MTSPLNFIKAYQLVQKMIGGGGADTKANIQDGDLISLYFSFRKESRLNITLTLFCIMKGIYTKWRESSV